MTEVIHTSCKNCGQDIEGIAPFPKGEWRDRGNNTTCPSGQHKGHKHVPYTDVRRSQDLAPLREEERPAETFIELYWHFRLNKSDALLVLKALGGRLKPSEVEAAKELGDYLTELRAKVGKENLRGLIQAYENLLAEKESGNDKDQGQ